MAKIANKTFIRVFEKYISKWSVPQKALGTVFFTGADNKGVADKIKDFLLNSDRDSPYITGRGNIIIIDCKGMLDDDFCSSVVGYGVLANWARLFYETKYRDDKILREEYETRYAIFDNCKGRFQVEDSRSKIHTKCIPAVRCAANTRYSVNIFIVNDTLAKETEESKNFIKKYMQWYDFTTKECGVGLLQGGYGIPIGLLVNKH